MTKISLNAQKVSQMKLRDSDMGQFSSNKQLKISNMLSSASKWISSTQTE